MSDKNHFGDELRRIANGLREKFGQNLSQLLRDNCLTQTKAPMFAPRPIPNPALEHFGRPPERLAP
jgi:hypothetical protein